jgi:hypothetical protein
MILNLYWKRSICVKFVVRLLLTRVRLPCILVSILVGTVLCVMFAGSLFQADVPWWHISGFTLVRSPWFVMCVARHSISKQAWKFISAHILVRSHTPVTLAASHSHSAPHWWCTGGTTWGRNPTSVTCVARPLLPRLCCLLIRSVMACQVFSDCAILGDTVSVVKHFLFPAWDYNYVIRFYIILMPYLAKPLPASVWDFNWSVEKSALLSEVTFLPWKLKYPYYVLPLLLRNSFLEALHCIIELSNLMKCFVLITFSLISWLALSPFPIIWWIVHVSMYT